MVSLPAPTDDIPRWVERYLGHLVCDAGAESQPVRRGGQQAADAALAALDITGYAKRRSQVHPASSRGASALSPYIRHGLLTLAEVVRAVDGAAATDRRKFIDELWWQEYARHLYARVGALNAAPLRREPALAATSWGEVLPDEMTCLREVRRELEHTGWLVNQTRMWIASHWSVRAGHDWRDGEDWMFRHLLDGSRAANRYGWQWSVGAMTSEAYGFSRWQVERRAPSWCASCAVASRCPIQEWPSAAPGEALDDGLLRRGPDLAGPSDPVITDAPEQVWLTAESLGDRDPALVGWPTLPAMFVFDEPLLRRLRLSSKRLVFIAETLAELAEHRVVNVRLGDPVEELAGVALAVTHAPVPGYQRRAAQLNVVATHPYPWLRYPAGGDVRSHSAWIRGSRQRGR